MKSGEKKTVAALRLILAALKQQEVDQRQTLDDNAVLAILTKLAKQRKESIAQYEQAGRDDLIAQEQFELELITDYLPAAASEAGYCRSYRCGDCHYRRAIDERYG